MFSKVREGSNRIKKDSTDFEEAAYFNLIFLKISLVLASLCVCVFMNSIAYSLFKAKILNR